jgi:sulfite exporter TauE/SafE
MEGAFFLGIASGGVCLASCGFLAAAFLTADRGTLMGKAALLAIFLAGRLVGYLAWAILAWMLGGAVSGPRGGGVVFAAADVILGGWLAIYGLSRPDSAASGKCPGNAFGNLFAAFMGKPNIRKIGLWGILSGLSLCPPFWAAVNGAAQTGSLAGSLFFFLIFYMGTGLWFIPFPVIGMLGRFPYVAQVARFFALPLGVYYIYLGLVAVAGGELFHG